MRRALILLTAAVFVLASGGCGDDGSGSGGSDGEARRVDDVAELAAYLDGVADGCALEYEALTDAERALSICTLGSDIAELSVWTEGEGLDALVEAAEGSGDPVVVGPNWSIDVTDPALADEVAAATGGTVHS